MYVMIVIWCALHRGTGSIAPTWQRRDFTTQPCPADCVSWAIACGGLHDPPGCVIAVLAVEVRRLPACLPACCCDAGMSQR